MILHHIILRNVGIYGGEHRIDLLPPDPDHPVILIGALNGGGKTTLLGALQLALYGSRARGIERTRKGYQRYLRELINRHAPPEEGASVTLEFERRIEGRPVIYTIRRGWHMVGSEVEESFRAHRNHEPDALLASHWDEAMDAYLPARLAHLFFFDGEQIERMADEEAASELLSTAFQSLLGLDLVEKLQEDLATLERRKRLSARSPEDRARLQLLEDEVKTAQSSVEQSHQNLVSLTTALERRQHELRQARDEFKNAGGELVAQREALEMERANLMDQRQAAEVAMREIAAGPAPFLLATDLLNELKAQAVGECAAHKERLIADAESARDERIMKVLAKKLPSDMCRTVSDVLVKHRPARAHLEFPIIVHADEELVDELEDMLRNTLPAARRDLQEWSAKWEELDDAVAALDRRLATVPDEDAIARMQHRIVKMEAELAEQQSVIKDASEQKRRAEFDLQIRQTALDKEMEKHADRWEDAEHDRRILDRIPKVKSTLDTFKARVVSGHIGALEKAILDSFQHLVRKPKLITGISIDPSTFHISLTDGDGKSLPFHLLSAGERQLLATSILWGLAKVSGRPVPLVIDTPLGRLDSHHRGHVVQRYFPTASHQTVLLSTDEEIVGRYHQMLRPFAGREYLIAPQPGSSQLQIIKQYFQEK